MAFKVNVVKDSIYRAYSTAKHFQEQKHIYKGGKRFLKDCMVRDLKQFYTEGMELPQRAIRLENEARFSVSLMHKTRPTYKEKMRNKYMNFLMDLRIKMTIQSDPELRKLKAKFDEMI